MTDTIHTQKRNNMTPTLSNPWLLLWVLWILPKQTFSKVWKCCPFQNPSAPLDGLLPWLWGLHSPKEGCLPANRIGQSTDNSGARPRPPTFRPRSKNPTLAAQFRDKDEMGWSQSWTYSRPQFLRALAFTQSWKSVPVRCDHVLWNTNMTTTIDLSQKGKN